MKVCYWATVNYGTRAFGAHFDDFPGCITADKNPLTLRENLKEVLQLHIRGMIEDNDTIPKPTGIDLPLTQPSTFIGFIPVVVDVPEAFTKVWNYTRYNRNDVERTINDFDNAMELFGDNNVAS